MRGMLKKRAQELRAQQLKQAQDMEHLIDKPWRGKASALELPNGAAILVDPGPKTTTLSLYVQDQGLVLTREVGNNNSIVSRKATTEAFIELGQEGGWIPRGNYSGIEAYIWASM